MIYYIAILFIAVLFNFLIKKPLNVLVSIIIVSILGYYINDYYKSSNYNNKPQNKEKILIEDIKNRDNINTNIFYIKKINKKLKYLILDEQLINIILNIRFVKKFDEAKYTDIINYMEKYMKIYIYILANRYDIKDYFSNFLDMRDKIFEEFYSIFIIIPNKLKSIYGLEPYKELYKSINDFRNYSNIMIKTLEKFSKNEKKAIYLEDTKYKTYIKNNIHTLP